MPFTSAALICNMPIIAIVNIYMGFVALTGLQSACCLWVDLC